MAYRDHPDRYRTVRTWPVNRDDVEARFQRVDREQDLFLVLQELKARQSLAIGEDGRRRSLTEEILRP
jgi:hypothetical protein